jgi:hypothetical protein
MLCQTILVALLNANHVLPICECASSNYVRVPRPHSLLRCCLPLPVCSFAVTRVQVRNVRGPVLAHGAAAAADGRAAEDAQPCLEGHLPTAARYDANQMPSYDDMVVTIICQMPIHAPDS